MLTKDSICPGMMVIDDTQKAEVELAHTALQSVGVRIGCVVTREWEVEVQQLSRVCVGVCVSVAGGQERAKRVVQRSIWKEH